MGTKFIASSCIAILALFFVSECSPESKNDSKRLIDARIAAKGQFPWMAALVLRDGGVHLCGGAILDHETILTAAHCFTSRGPYPTIYSIVIGPLIVSERKKKRDYYDISTIRANPQFYQLRGMIMPYDVAVVKLKRKIKFSYYVKPIRLPKNKDEKPLVGQACSISGFGQLPSFGMAPQLMYTELQVARNSECESFYSSMRVSIPLPHTRLCTTGYNWRNVCEGDSGSPLACRSSDGDFVLQGIVSYGMGCARPPLYPSPSIFTRVTSFLDWIQQNRI